jgi:hypothetical protein
MPHLCAPGGCAKTAYEGQDVRHPLEWQIPRQIAIFRRPAGSTLSASESTVSARNWLGLDWMLDAHLKWTQRSQDGVRPMRWDPHIARLRSGDGQQKVDDLR